MGSIFGGGGDNKAMMAQIEQQRQETERLRAQTEAESVICLRSSRHRLLRVVVVAHGLCCRMRD